MNSVYNHGLKQTQTITKDLTEFEKNLSTSPLSLQGAITTSITAFKKTIKEYSDLIDKNLSQQQDSIKHENRLKKFNNDLIDFQNKFDNLRKQRDLIVQESNKQELLGRRHLQQQAPSTPNENPYDTNSNSSQQQSTMSYREGLYHEKNSLERGSQQLDKILEMGQQAFEDIVEQNEILRKIQSTFENSLLTLGVSQGTIRSVERRAKQDKWLFWFCVVMMLIIFYYIVKWFR